MSYTSQQQHLPPNPSPTASFSRPRIGVDYTHQRQPPLTLYNTLPRASQWRSQQQDPSVPRRRPSLPFNFPVNSQSESANNRRNLLQLNLVNLDNTSHKQSVRPYPPLPVSPRQFTKLSPPPPLFVSSRPHPRTVFSSSKPQPLRLVQESLHSRKRKPPVFFAQHTRTLVQSVTYITIHQDSSYSSSAPTSPTSSSYSPTALTTTTFDKMANTNPTMPKVSNLPPVPAGARSGYLSPTKEEMLADLRRQVNNLHPCVPICACYSLAKR